MTESVYRVWLDDDKMRQGKQAYQRTTFFHQLLVNGSNVFIAISCLAFVQWAAVAFRDSSSSFLFSVLSALFFGLSTITTISNLLPDFLHRHSTACCDWTQQHTAKAFGNYFVKRAVAADIPVAEANEAMARFLAKGNICYEAFDVYCRGRQQEAEQQAAAVATAEKGRKEQESYQKNLDRLNKKFARADADAQS